MSFFKLHWIVKAAGIAARFLGVAGKPNSTPVAPGVPFTVQTVLQTVQQVVAYGGIDTKSKFDQWLELVDATTGSDVTTLDLFKGLPAAAEEELFDHLIEVARIYGYHLLGVRDYCEVPEEPPPVLREMKMDPPKPGGGAKREGASADGGS